MSNRSNSRLNVVVAVAIALAMLTAVLTAVTPYSNALAASQPLAKKSFVGKVQRVLTGDRLRVQRGKQRYTVTLAGIDAPTGSECFSLESRLALMTLATPGSTVRLSNISGKKRKIVAYLTAGTTDVNAAMISGGYAESTGASSNFDQLESEARTAGKGLFSACSASDSSPGSSTAPSSSGSGSNSSNGSGGSTPQSTTEYTAAQKREIISRYSTNLVGLQVSFSTGNGTVTDTYGISFCSPTVYSLFQISSFSGSGSTSSQHAGSWRIAEAGGVPNQSEIVRIAFSPGEPGRDPFFVDLGQIAGGAVLANNRQAELTRNAQC
jgi:endonuclease YncB( thermonuclease family)